MVRFVTIDKHALESGYTQHAIRAKIRDGVWREGEVWVKAPDGRILIDAEGYDAWAASAAKARSGSKLPRPASVKVRAVKA
jgi:hypothetical protein